MLYMLGNNYITPVSLFSPSLPPSLPSSQLSPSLLLLQKRVKEGVDPPEGSERDVAFHKSREYLHSVVKEVINRRREGKGEEDVPFIDHLLQSGVPEDQASDYITLSTEINQHSSRP